MNYRVLSHKSIGQGDFGWLKAKYLYSFANSYNPDRMGFRKLLVINHDRIAAKKGFPKHHHSDMEIITIPLKNAISHQDSAGGVGRVATGDFQYMSAGTGIFHSEMNNEDVETELLQIWIQPEKQGTSPSYFDSQSNWLQNNGITSLVDNQDNLAATISMGNLKTDQTVDYHCKYQNQVIYLIEGKITVNEIELGQGDLIEISDNKQLFINSLIDSKLLLIELA
jgi:quercetin 2,3-dioxygenase